MRLGCWRIPVASVQDWFGLPAGAQINKIQKVFDVIEVYIEDPNLPDVDTEDGAEIPFIDQTTGWKPVVEEKRDTRVPGPGGHRRLG